MNVTPGPGLSVGHRDAAVRARAAFGDPDRPLEDADRVTSG
jgi:hypothetical protein